MVDDTRELDLLRRIVRDTCVVWQGRREALGRNPDGTVNVKIHPAKGSDRARLVLDDTVYLTDPGEISIIDALLHAEDEGVAGG